MFMLRHRNRGFTLVEVMITVALIGILAVSGAGIGFFTNLYNLMRNTFELLYVRGDLETRCCMGLETMVRGIDSYKGLYEARAITLPTSDHVVYTDSEDVNITREFYKSGSQVKYVNGIGVVSVVPLLDSDVSSLTFSDNPTTEDLTVTLTMAKTGYDGSPISVTKSAVIKSRNR